MITRRGVLTGLLAAPAIIKLAPLMKISPVRTELIQPPQMVLGETITLAGTWHGQQPYALDYSLDGGTSWHAAHRVATCATGVWSAEAYVPQTPGLHVISVRDHNNPVCYMGSQVHKREPAVLTVHEPFRRLLG